MKRLISSTRSASVESSIASTPASRNAPRSAASRFAAAAAKREALLRDAFREAGVDAMELSTEADLVEEISRFIDLRRRRSRSNVKAAA